MPLTTDPTNPDTDGDGLLDGEEIDQTISWKRVINDTGDGSHGTYCIYFNMLSDPTKVDTDGDGVGDGNAYIADDIEILPQDPKPLQHGIVPYLEELCELAIEYNDDFEISQKLVLDYIRAGKYNDDEYLGSGNWENTSGTIDTDFVDYVNERNPNIKEYLYAKNTDDTKYYIDPITGKYIDLSHLAATFSAYLYDTSNFKMWVGSWWEKIPNYTEDDIDNLAGWAGDLQSMVQKDLLIYYDCAFGEEWVGDHYFDEEILNCYDEDYYKTLVLELLENKPQDDFDASSHVLLNGKRIRNTTFRCEDQLADIDAVNIFVYYYDQDEKTTIADCIEKYYSDLDSSKFYHNRYEDFVVGIFAMDEDNTYSSDYWDICLSHLNGDMSNDKYKLEVTELFYSYILKYTMSNAPDGKKWSLYRNAPVTNNVSKGTARAFSEYIINQWSLWND